MKLLEAACPPSLLGNALQEVAKLPLTHNKLWQHHGSYRQLAAHFHVGLDLSFTTLSVTDLILRLPQSTLAPTLRDHSIWQVVQRMMLGCHI